MKLFEIQKEGVGERMGTEYARSRMSCHTYSSGSHAKGEQKNGLLHSLSKGEKHLLSKILQWQLEMQNSRDEVLKQKILLNN